jgi:hypothetical protein
MTKVSVILGRREILMKIGKPQDDKSVSILLVAGAGFEPATFGL